MRMVRSELGPRPERRCAALLVTGALFTSACASVAVHGVVLDEHAAPLATASFTLRPPSGTPELSHATADRNGCFDLYENVPRNAHEYTLSVSAPGYKSLTLTVPTRRDVLLLVTLASSSGDTDSSARPITPAERARLFGIPCEPPVMGRSLALH